MMNNINYNKLFKLLIDKGWKKTDLGKKAGISPNTLAKLSKNEYVSMDVLVKLAIALNCTLDDIVQITFEGKD